MVTAKKITDECWKINVDSNVYIFPSKKLVIDTGPASYKEDVRSALSEVIDPSKIEKVVLTHLHYDHCENIDLFPNAKIYASPDAVAALKEDRMSITVSPTAGKILQERGVLPLKKLEGFDIIDTPGHCAGHICLFYKKDKILFTGDLYFREGVVGRSDLPTSDPSAMEASLELIKDIHYDILCPGHDY